VNGSHIRLLVVEDAPADYELALRWLAQAGFSVRAERVDSAAELERALQSKWEAFLVDYHVPGIEILPTIERLARDFPTTPLLVVSGAVGEETAAEVLRAGARDLVLKDNLTRLGPALERELVEAALREQREAELEEALRRFHEAFDRAPTGMARIDLQGHWLEVNDALCSMLGYRREALLALSYRDVLHERHHRDWNELVRAISSGKLERLQMERHFLHGDGRTLDILVALTLVRDRDRRPLHVFLQLQDITAQKQLEQELQEARAQLAEARAGVASGTEPALLAAPEQDESGRR
jgi:PAS domain S-box-containing protein